MDLAIPRLIQRIIDQGSAEEQSVVLQTAALMLGISILSALFAIGNNIFSIRVGEGVAGPPRGDIHQDPSFAYGNIDHFTTGPLDGAPVQRFRRVQRVFQVSLRIGTRGPLLMIGSLILMFRHQPGLGRCRWCRCCSSPWRSLSSLAPRWSPLPQRASKSWTG